MLYHAVAEKTQQNIVSEIDELLNQGETYERIRKVLLTCPKQTIKSCLTKKKDDKERNLLTTSDSYIHPMFSVRNTEFITDFNLEHGTMTSRETAYYMEPRASFTLRQLLTYVKEIIPYDEMEYTDARMYGILQYNIRKYGIDMLMFMLEAISRKSTYEDDVSFGSANFMALDKFHSLGVSYMEELNNNRKYCGGDKIVPRARVLFS